MGKHEKKRDARTGVRALGRYPVILLFFGFLAVMILADCLTPLRTYSELENKSFISRPGITLSELTGSRAADKVNTFFTNYSTFVKEQFAGRDGWIDLQSRCESLLFQKTDYGNILYGADGMELPRTYGLTASEQLTLPKNTAAVAALGQRYPGQVYLMAVPSAACIYPENVPAGAPLLDENAYLDDLYAQVGGSVNVVDLRETLTAHKDEYLYYRTDHHWTTEGGAYYGYEALCGTLGLTPFDRPAHTAQTVPDFLGTSYSKCRQWNVQPDTITCYDIDSTLTVYRIMGPDTFEVASETGLYDTEKFGAYDKYGAFLYGNNGYSRLSGRGEGSILLLKDSYANCFAPYLTDNYENVDVVDLRFYNYGLDALIQANGYDAIVVLYSFASFRSDASLYKAGVAG